MKLQLKPLIAITLLALAVCVMERRGGEVVLDSLSKRLSRLNN
jgi:hypothetical protein